MSAGTVRPTASSLNVSSIGTTAESYKRHNVTKETTVPHSEKDLAGKDLRNINFSGMSLREADLSHTRLDGAFLRGVDLTDADLSDADLHGAHLEGAQLGGANLHNADFTDADVRGAQIENAAMLDGVQLTNAKGVPDSVDWHDTALPPATEDTNDGLAETNVPGSVTPFGR
jgi:uncharacterized protein YjbI with pentapeptide repeats